MTWFFAPNANNQRIPFEVENMPPGYIVITRERYRYGCRSKRYGNEDSNR